MRSVSVLRRIALHGKRGIPTHYVDVRRARVLRAVGKALLEHDERRGAVRRHKRNALTRSPFQLSSVVGAPRIEGPNGSNATEVEASRSI